MRVILSKKPQKLIFSKKLHLDHQQASQRLNNVHTTVLHPPPQSPTQSKDKPEPAKKTHTGHWHQNSPAFESIQYWSNQNFDPVNVAGLMLSETFELSYLRNILVKNLKHRIANMVLFLDELPYGVSFTPSIDRLITKYLHAFQTLCHLSDKDENFDEIMKRMLSFNAKDPIEVAVGINEWRFHMGKRYRPNDNFEMYSNKVDDCLNRFYSKRTSGRLMCQNYFSIRETGKSLTEKNIDIKLIIDEAYQMAKLLAIDKYGLSPKLVVEGGLERPFNYVTPHLVTILLELLKNALEATMIKHQHSAEIPPVTILISQFQNKVVMKIHDEGIGIAPDDMPKIWSYFYSTSSDSIHRLENLSSDAGLNIDRLINASLLSGFGYGLPLTKTLLQFFGGQININSIKNVCTDVYVYFGSDK